MKSFLKGFLLGIALVAVNHVCVFLFGNSGEFALRLFSGIIFFAITTAFLVSKDMTSLFACGFSGLFVMLFFGLAIAEMSDLVFGWTAYEGGFWGSMSALVVSIYLTSRKTELSSLICKGEIPMNIEMPLKIKLLLYAVVSALSFSYLIMPENAGISVPLFSIVQFALLWFIVPDRKRLMFFIPVFIMSFNSFWSASTIWRPSNFLLSIICYCCMFTKFDFKTDSLQYVAKIVTKLFSPFLKFTLPFRWALELNSGKAPVIKKIIVALAITLPCALVLIAVLANADMVFSMQVDYITKNMFSSFGGRSLFIALCGIFAGLYLFGIISGAYTEETPDNIPHFSRKGDLIIINILLSFVLLIYTSFVIIQFKYLFAASALPYGLSYTEYARKGFFELLALTGVNIAAILLIIRLTKGYSGKWFILTKSLCHYLCGVTVILLISSFYRMLLYTNDDGLTRLRLFVMGFLVFEAIGLVATFFYIAKPRFNITLVYFCIAFAYYLILNIVPADRIIAQNQVDRYFNGKCESVSYIYTLSADAAPAMQKLYETGDEHTRQEIQNFLEWNTNSDIPRRWQRYNTSVNWAENFLITKFY